MKNNKGLIIAIICVIVAIVGIVTAMVLTNVFAKDKEENESVATTLSEATSTEEEKTSSIPAVTRPKTKRPDSVATAIYANYSDKSAAEIANYINYGFNTVIFELTADNCEKVIPLIESAKNAKLYFGVKADASESDSYIVDFIKNNNVDFVIISGLDKTADYFENKITKLYQSIKKIDAATEIGIEPLNAENTDSETFNIINKNSDFIFIAQKSNDKAGAESFANTQIAWSDKSSPLWLCHNLTGISSFDAERASENIALIAASAEMSTCKGIIFSSYAEITSAKGAAAESVVEYVKTRKTDLLDKELEITSHTTPYITVEQSSVTFRGTSSPAYDLICNGQKLEVAKNGDFSVDCELGVGKNKITFEHKGKTYVYNVTYKLKILKSVSPSSDTTLPGEMEVNVTAIALKGSNLVVAFNGKTVNMTELDGIYDEGNDSPETDTDFCEYTATLKLPAGKTTAQKLGRFTVKATYGSQSEILSGGNITIKAITAPPPPPETTVPPATTKKPATTTPATKPPVTEKPTKVESSAESTEKVTADSTTNSAATTKTPATKAPTTKAPTTKAPTTTPPKTTGAITVTSHTGPKLERYYYTQNYGKGTARICEIIDDYVETYPGYTTSTYSVPDCSPLAKTTVDYVKDEAVLDGSDKYYILASGVKVPEFREERLPSGSNGKIKHVKIASGYVMPKNSIRVLSTTCNNDKTVIVLDMNRPVAFNAKITGQTYGKYAPDRYVTVSSLDCKGLEFVFSDTSDASGSTTFMNSAVKSGKWSSDSSKSTVTLSLTLTTAGKFYGFHYEYNKDGTLTISINHKPKSLKDAVIMLDPGHGGIDSGAVCTVKATGFNYEKNINLSLATKVKVLLEAEGATVIMTRDGDDWKSYTQRNDEVRNREPDMFIAIHCDSSTASSATGTSAYYYRAYSQPLAKAVHDSLVNAYKTQIYKDKPSVKVDRGSNFYAFRVARVEECPAILIEYGFVSNTLECQALQNTNNRDILAKATVDGIKKYLANS